MLNPNTYNHVNKITQMISYMYDSTVKIYNQKEIYTSIKNVH